ncbi:MAG TPA: hypothetical protein VEH04_18500 [Verrucomicrobiae bacterium]|nr:hypothetical protein [Verrucomicrobiae bacterium]
MARLLGICFGKGINILDEEVQIHMDRFMELNRFGNQWECSRWKWRNTSICGVISLFRRFSILTFIFIPVTSSQRV